MSLIRTLGRNRPIFFSAAAAGVVALATGVAISPAGARGWQLVREAIAFATQRWLEQVIALERQALLLERLALPVAMAAGALVLLCAALTVLWLLLRHRRAAGERMREIERAGQFSTFTWWPAKGRLQWSQRPGFLGGMADRPFPAWGDLLHPGDRAASLKAFQEMATVAAHYDIEFRVRNGEAGYRWVLLRASALAARDGTPASVAGIFMDVTEHCQAEELVREAALELVLREFATSLSDTLNNSLAALTNTVYLLLHDAQLQPPVRQALLEIAAMELACLGQLSKNIVGLADTSEAGSANLGRDALNGVLRPDLRS